MSLIDYANDVNLDVEKIKQLCDKLGITYEDDNTLLNDYDIVMLDKEVENINVDEDSLEDELSDEEVTDIAEELAQQSNIDLENQKSFEKVKSKVVKKQEAKNNFAK